MKGMSLLSRSRAPKRDAERVVRVLAVHDGDAERSRRVIDLVVRDTASVLGPERFAAAVEVRALDLAVETTRRGQLARCRDAELVLGLDAEHLRRLPRPLLARHRIFTLEEFTLTLEAVADAAHLHPVVSLFERGYAAFSRSVIASACAARGLVRMSALRTRPRAAALEEYAPRLARAVGDLAIGRLLAD